MNPIPNEKPLAIIGSIHAEDGKIFHVHKSSVNKARNLIEIRAFKVTWETKKDGLKGSDRKDGIFCPRCYQTVTN